MAEEKLLDQLKSLLSSKEIDTGIKVLKENTGKGKIIDPSETSKMEKIWSFFANPLIISGKLEDADKVCMQMYEFLLQLQMRENERYHKGFSLYNDGMVKLRQALQLFLYSFIEDTISSKGFPEKALSVSALQGIYKVDSDFLHRLSDNILAKIPDARNPEEALVRLDIKGVPAELWIIEYQMQEIETKLRKFIESKFSVDTEWYEKRVSEEIKKSIEDRIKDSSELLWFSEQTTSPLDYLLFPREYIALITDDKNWKDFEPTFKHKALIEGKLKGLGQIRNKIAHYRRISIPEKQMFEETINWISGRLAT